MTGKRLVGQPGESMSQPASIVAVVLAAGSSRRFGSDKRRYPVAGKPLVQHTLAQSLSLGMPTMLVLKPEDALILDELAGPWLGNDRLTIVYAEHAAEGMGHSLAAAAAVAARKGGYDGLLVQLADMPYVDKGTLSRLCDSLRYKGISVPRYRGSSGHPVLFAADWFDHLAGLTGDRGARAILRDNPAQVSYVDVDDPGVIQDLDHPPAEH